MSEERKIFRDAAIEAISDMAQHLPLDCQLFVVACRPESKYFDLVLPSPEANLNNALDALRRHGLGIDGDNAYKRDLCDMIVGSLALGSQDRNPPPPGHWAQVFWDIGRQERALCDELVAALRLTRENLRACQATIHLCGGFDPAYVNDAQAAMKIADVALAKAGS